MDAETPLVTNLVLEALRTLMRYQRTWDAIPYATILLCMSKSSVTRKRLADQVIVITGASSGIGLATAQLAAKRGARLVLVSRNEMVLRHTCESIQADGGEAIYVVADVADYEAVKRVRDAAIERFGEIDTWVNNAGVTMFGLLTDEPIEDEHRVFDVNYWGVVHGSRAAVSHLKERGGALINVGSGLSDRAIPLQGTYCASKHAVKGYTDALRMELEKAGAPVSVTLIKPSSCDTPITRHARNHLSARTKLPPPYYAPEAVARVILFCAEHMRREIAVGGAGAALRWSEMLAPRLTDLCMRFAIFRLQKSKGKPRQSPDSLDSPVEEEGSIRGDYDGIVLKRSAYSAASLHPFMTGFIALAALLGVRALLGSSVGRTQLK